jgi:hypothetical protein
MRYGNRRNASSSEGNAITLRQHILPKTELLNPRVLGLVNFGRNALLL